MKTTKSGMFRIGYDAKRLFNNATGLGNYSRTLLRNMATYYPDNEYFLYAPSVQKNPETAYYLQSPLFSVHTPTAGWGAFWRAFSIVHLLKRHKIRLFHGLSHEIPAGLANAGIPVVVTMHDLAFRMYPEFYRWPDRQIYHYKVSYAVRNAERIIAISESTRQDLIEMYKVDPERVTVIYQSCHERFQQEKSTKTIDRVLQKYQLPRDYLLFVGTVNERKNLLVLLEAMRQLPAGFRLPLVVVGDGKAYLQKVMEFIRKHRLQEEVFFIHPENEDMPAIYQQADVFVYPSLYEGFGIPILEALYSETPVITSNCSSLPEAAGPDSLLINPRNPAEISEGICKILGDSDYRKNMIAKGYQYAQQFQGDVLSARLMELYEDILDMDAIS
jgi:glycosyltransferase involved in cell wall biosynthesis